MTRTCRLLAVGLTFTLAPASALGAAAIADAAENRAAAKVHEFIEHGADVNAPQPDGMTALHWAVYHDDLRLTRLLVKAGADVEAVNQYDVSPLSIACTNGNGEIVAILLEAGANPRATLPGGETVLMTAARTGRIGPVQSLLNRGADVNAKDRNGQTALMWAAAEGHGEAVDALLQAGAEFRKPLPSGFTPLFFAVREGRTEVALRLLKAGVDVDDPMRTGKDRSGPSPLLLAVENGHFETALSLLEAGADPDGRPEGYTALHALTWVRKPIRGDGDPAPVGSGKLSSLELARRLIDHGADVDMRLKNGSSGRAQFTTTGSTPFLLAARTGDMPLMKALLEHDADPLLANVDGCTPLLAAAGVGDLGSGQETAGTEDEAMETVRLLLELGADINTVDDNGETAMHGAAYQNWPRLVALLSEHGANVEVWNRKNKWGWTPLQIAQGHRLGNFRPDPKTIAAIENALNLRDRERDQSQDTVTR